ncbi:MAG TPA: PLP-dependent aminotransferase family protein, partial [Candidatus Limnocylindrales bacterium]|nr:PLP-dependent aminotransferase family protein [Candidatus Limnocylindrales bacterium]
MSVTSRAPLTQASVRDGVIELAIGQPEPSLLPTLDLAASTASALHKYDADALGYGAEYGPWPLLDWLSAHLGAIDARSPGSGELLITAGISTALELIATAFTRHGDVVLVEVPTYHLALGILRDHGAELVGVETDADGLRVDAVEAAVATARAVGKRVSLLYTIPTFGNPTGRTLPIERRAALARVAAANDLVIAEDDVYRELWFSAPPPPSIGAVDPVAPVLRMGSFSKSLAPGLRLGWISGPSALVGRVVEGGVLASGGGLNPMIALAVAEYAAAGKYEPNVARLRDVFRSRSAALVGAIREALPGATLADPEGGYFVWLRLPDGLSAESLLPAADAAGLTYQPA